VVFQCAYVLGGPRLQRFRAGAVDGNHTSILRTHRAKSFLTTAGGASFTNFLEFHSRVLRLDSHPLSFAPRTTCSGAAALRFPEGCARQRHISHSPRVWICHCARPSNEVYRKWRVRRNSDSRHFGCSSESEFESPEAQAPEIPWQRDS